MKLNKLRIKNYKSLKNLELELNSLNVLIGANGAGKSNFVSLFKMMNSIVNQRLQLWTADNVGAENILHFGLKNSDHFFGQFWFGQNGYKIELKPKADGSFYFSQEELMFKKGEDSFYTESLGVGHFESKLAEIDHKKDYYSVAGYIERALKSWKYYHFHDTSATAGIKQPCEIGNNRELASDAGNLASVLYTFKQQNPLYVKRIEKYLKLILPCFDRFVLEPDTFNDKMIKLGWLHTNSEKVFEAYHLSDGTLRFICLATLLNQPKMPDVIIIDEPELGLHPYAINILSDMLHKAKESTQLIVATQSAELLNHLEPEDIIVADHKQQATTLSRLNEEDLSKWLEDYSLGELWDKNLLGGRP